MVKYFRRLAISYCKLLLMLKQSTSQGMENLQLTGNHRLLLEQSTTPICVWKTRRLLPRQSTIPMWRTRRLLHRQSTTPSGFAPGPKVPQFQGFLQLGLINIIRPSWLCHMHYRTATFFAHCIVVFIRSLPEHGVFAAPLFSSGNHFQPYLYALSVPLSSTLELNQASTTN